MASKTGKQRPVRVKAALGDPFQLAWPPVAETLSAELVEALKEALGAAGLGRAKARSGNAGSKRGGKRGGKANKRRRRVREKATDEKMEDEGVKRDDENMEVDGRSEVAIVDKRVASGDHAQMKEKAVDAESVNDTRGEGESADTRATPMANAVVAANVHAGAFEEANGASGNAGLSDGACRGGWNDASVRREVALGVNEVLRGLERDELSLVLVCDSARPPLLPRLLAALCASRAVPAAQLGALSAAVAPLLGLRSLLALGVRRDAPSLAPAAERIGQKLPPLHVAWLSGAGAEAGPEAGGDTGGGRLLPTCVKRLVSNPARKKRKRT